MKIQGTIAEIRRSRDGITLIIDTEMGLRGVEFERELLDQIVSDFELAQDDDLIGWTVEYDPAHGDLDVMMPDDAELDDDPPEGTDDHAHNTE
jgi:hypothetical protein